MPVAFSGSSQNGTLNITFEGWPDGEYTLAVACTDESGFQDPSPALVQWVLDNTSPSSSIGQSPAAVSPSTNATFTFACSDGFNLCSYWFRLDSAVQWTSLLNFSSVNVSFLTDGSHTLAVKATGKVLFAGPLLKFSFFLAVAVCLFFVAMFFL
jgi:hypothetical protein